MKKYVFALALLHLCVSARSDTNLNNEIITRLRELRKKDIFIFNATVKAPTRRTSQTPHKCLGMVKKELEHLLDNLIVKNEDERCIAELKGNLNALGHHKENKTCLMKTEQNPRSALGLYIFYFMKLNTRA